MPAYYPKEFFSETQIEEEYNFCFVFIPFEPQFNDIYKTIKEATKQLGLSCNRSDDFYKSGRIMNTILENIQRAEIIIADLTGKNANVFYELGIAHCVKSNIILLTQSMKDVPFDLQDFHVLPYKNTIGGRIPLKKAIINAIKQLRGDRETTFNKHAIQIDFVQDAQKTNANHWLMKTPPDKEMKKGVQRVVKGKITENTEGNFNELLLYCDIYTDKWYPQETLAVKEDGSWEMCPEFGGREHKVRLTLKKGGLVLDRVEFFVNVIKMR